LRFFRLSCLGLCLAFATGAAAEIVYSPDFAAAELTTSIPGLSPQAQAAVLARIGAMETVSPIHSAEGEDIAEANAFLVSPCYALVNEHAAVGDDRDQRGDRAVRLKFGGGGWVKGRVVVYDAPRDFALIRIDSCPGRSLGWLTPDTRSPKALGGEELFMAGFRFDDNDRPILTIARCRARKPVEADGAHADWIHDDCPSEDGVSGSALLTTAGGEVKVAALHVGVFPGDEPRFGVALSLASVLSDPDVAALIDADLESAPPRRD
jgi:S1-C subfamily serine protease